MSHVYTVPGIVVVALKRLILIVVNAHQLRYFGTGGWLFRLGRCCLLSQSSVALSDVLGEEELC